MAHKEEDVCRCPSFRIKEKQTRQLYLHHTSIFSEVQHPKELILATRQLKSQIKLTQRCSVHTGQSCHVLKKYLNVLAQIGITANLKVMKLTIRWNHSFPKCSSSFFHFAHVHAEQLSLILFYNTSIHTVQFRFPLVCD